MPGLTTTTVNFTVPAIGSNVQITVGDTSWMGQSMVVMIQTAGYYDVRTINSATLATVRNLGYSVNALPTTVINSGSAVSPGPVLGGAAPTRTRGDIMVDNGVNDPDPSLVRLAVGTDGKALVANSGQATGLAYSTISPNLVNNSGNIATYSATTGTPIALQDSKLLITSDGEIQSTATGGNARGVKAVDLQVERLAPTQVASGLNSVICGGKNNTSSNDYCAIVGGQGNTANGENSFVGGGIVNSSGSGQNSGVCCGTGNQAIGNDAFVGGGNGNTAQGETDFVGAGAGNSASGNISAVVAGSGNAASGSSSFIGAGTNNIASGEFATIIGGFWGLANKYGQTARASGRFAAQGDAQTSELILRNLTTDATPTALYLNGVTATQRATIAANTTWTFSGLAVARHTGTGDSKTWKFEGGIKRDGASNTVLIGAVTPAVIAADAGAAAWSLGVTADNSNEALQIEATGEAAHNIRWVAWVRLVEVTFA